MEGWDPSAGSSLLQHVERLAKKQRTDVAEKHVDEIIAALSGWLEENGESGASVEPPADTDMGDTSASEADRVRARSLSALIDSLGVENRKEAIHEYHKELTSLVSKLGKAIDKVVPGNLDQALPQLELDPRLIDEAVCTHLLSVGLFGVAEALVAEAGLDGSRCMALMPDLREIHSLCDAMRERRLAPALQWLARKRPELRERGAWLEFCLHRLQYVELLRDRKTHAALIYLRRHLTHLAPLPAASLQASGAGGGSGGEAAAGAGGAARPSEMHDAHVQLRRLVGAMAYAHRLGDSPYAVSLMDSV